MRNFYLLTQNNPASGKKNSLQGPRALLDLLSARTARRTMGTQKTKRCAKCGIRKTIDKFASWGTSNRCKECRAAYVRSQHSTSYKPQPKFSVNRKNYSPAKALQNLIHKALYPQQVKTRRMLRKAILNGNIVRPLRCQLCWETGRRIEAHHNDYDKPLEVVWLCVRCHIAITPRRRAWSLKISMDKKPRSPWNDLDCSAELDSSR